MQKNTTYNTQLAKQLKERNCIAMDLLIEGLRYCNDRNHNLGEYVLDKKWISICEYAEIIQSIYEYVPSQMKFDKYVIIKELGRGGMGIVYLVVRENSTRILVLKTLLQCDRDHIKRFYKEARAVSTLQHPNIVPVYDFGQQNGIPYFTMKYIKGTDFQQFLQKNRNIDTSIQIIVTICQALHYIHKKNIIHRDIKPANILLDKELNPYLTDFGLVKIPGQASMTKNGDILGTIHYTSPEQAQGLKNISSKTDVYSLGVLLYEALTGKTPFADYNMIAAYRKVVKSIPPEPQKYHPSVPDALNEICIRAMHRNPNKRYSALRFASVLQQYKNTPNLSSHMKIIRRSQRWFFSKGWLIIVSLTIIFSATFLWWRQYNHHPQQWYTQYLTDSLQDSRRSDALLVSAKSLIAENNFLQAYPLLQQAQKLNSSNIEVLYYFALCLESQHKYQQAITLLTKCIALAPWEANYFKKRGELYQKIQLHSEAIYDFFRCIDLDSRNIFVVKNIYNIALSGTSPRLLFIVRQIFTERSFLHYARPHIDLFQPQKNKLCAEIMNSRFLYYSQQPTTQSQIATFVEQFLQQRDTEPQKSAYKALLLHPKKSMAYIDTLLRSTTDKQVERLIQLRKDLQQHYIKNMRVFILHAIVTYVQVKKKNALCQMYSWGEDAINILQNLIIDHSQDEITRYYAAEIFFELNLSRAYEFTYQTLQNNRDLNLVCILKILAHKYRDKLQQLNSAHITLPDQKTLSVNKQQVSIEIGKEIASLQVMPFVKVQARDYIKQSILQELIQPTQPSIVRLYILEKFDLSTNKEAYDVLSYFLSRDDEHHRGFAHSLLTPKITSYESHLLHAMKDSSFLVRSTAISRIDKSCSPQIFTTLRNHLQEEQNNFIRLQCIISLALANHFLQDILVNPNENIALRFATMFYFSTKRKFAANQMTTIIDLLKDKDKIMRFFIAYNFMRRKFGPMASMALSFIDDKDYYNRLGVAASISPFLSTKLRTYALSDSKQQVRNVALISLVNVYIQKGIDRLQNHIIKTKSFDFSNSDVFFRELRELDRIYKQKEGKEWLAFGHRYFLYRIDYEIDRIHATMLDEFNVDHATYLQKLVNKIITGNPVTLFCLDFLSLKAMVFDKGHLRKLERSAVVYGLFKRDPTPKRYREFIDVLQSIDKRQPLQKYWLADVYFYKKKYAKAKKIIAEAIADEPWNVQFLKLRNQINKHSE